jgi:hypothetical protein
MIYVSHDYGGSWTPTSAPSAPWVSVASSADGTRLVAVVGGDIPSIAAGDRSIYVSADSGATWNRCAVPPNDWGGVASSADGITLIAVAGGYGNILWGGYASPGPIYLSHDSGATWQQTSAPSNYWGAVACSANAMTIVVGGVVAPTFLSMDRGATWAPVGLGFEGNGLACSAESSAIVAGTFISMNSGSSWDYIGGDNGYGVGPMCISSDGAKVFEPAYGTWPYTGPWRLSSAPSGHWLSIAASADGVTLAAADGYAAAIYLSTNSGVSWLQTSAPSNDWSVVALSGDGKRLIAAPGSYDGGNGPIFTSVDSGSSWARTSSPSNYWGAVAASTDGAVLIAAATGYDGKSHPLFVSQNSGAAWQTTGRSNLWSSVACSADGTKLVACATLNSSYGADGLIYTSSDSGTHWIPTSAPASDWWCVASSADGVRLVAAMGDDPNSNGGPGFIYVSPDSGTTWIHTSAPSNYWASVASSGDGSRLIAVGGIGGFTQVYFSTDFGTSWTILDTPTSFGQTICCSSNASVSAALISDSHASWIVTLRFPPPQLPLPVRLPQLVMTRSVDRAVVSWLVPSSSFALQESADLFSPSWTDVPMPPTLNFTNLHYELNISPSPGSHFYRLKQH